MLKTLLRAFLVLRLESCEPSYTLEFLLALLRRRAVVERVIERDRRAGHWQLRCRIDAMFPF